MSFISIAFVCLFSVTAFLYWFVKNQRSRQLVLLLASYIFYGYWDYRFLSLLLIQTTVCYFVAVNAEDNAKGKRYLTIGIIISLGILGFFKYFNFFIDSIEFLFNVDINGMISIILPVGISFYTFQAISYMIDAYRGSVLAEKDFLKVALYISFFPQLVAGPIVKASDFMPQLQEEKSIKSENVERAVWIFMIGLFKKVVIADRLSVCVDAVFSAPLAYNSISIVLAVFSYALQIYCDFSGYSDMAIGVALFFGYDLCENFNLPYFSKNPSEFWKRWHISLSTWLKEYLYIPLGGNRKGKTRTYINLLLTMIIGGLWHGAGWNFIIWGGLHGVALVVHKIFVKYIKIPSSRLVSILSVMINFTFVCICWVFFRAQTLSDAITILSRMIIPSEGISYIYIYTIIYGIILFIAQLYIYFKNAGVYFYLNTSVSKWKDKFLLCMMGWLIFLFAYGGENAFVYFQF